ncbi:MAG TPA: class I SAM-dependent methyltransferase [Bryobacteraceae bacterium]|nr:class I SAM-dependent methyltransferase [Bryobacteraceae bacterium]
MQSQILATKAETTDAVNRPCPICECAQRHHLSEHTFVLPEGHPLESGYAVVICDSCGFAYADTVANQAAHDRFYAHLSKYEDQVTSTGGGYTTWDEQRLRDAALVISRSIPTTARILDIGCANGGLLVELRRLGHKEVFGMDPSALCVRHTIAKEIRAWVGSLSAIASGMGAFDCVILSHVLEHVHDLAGALKSVGSLLEPDGIVYAEVPDASRYHDFLYSPFQDFNTEHINHFSPLCLSNLFQVHGFRQKNGGIKDIASSEDSLTPALYGVFEKADMSDPKLQRDEALHEALTVYVERSRAMLTRIDRRLRQQLHEQQPVIVWGTGQLTMKLLSDTVLKDQPITAFVDKNPVNHGRILRRIAIVSPEEIARQNSEAPIVVASLLHGKSIERDIRGQYGLRNPLVSLSLQ